MPALFPRALAVLALLAGAPAVAQPSTERQQAAGVRRIIELPAEVQREVPSLRISPGFLTTLLFGAPLKLVGVELEERERFVRVTELEDALMLMPGATLPPGMRLRLRVRLEDGVAPTNVDFLLVVSPDRAEQQVEVYRPPPVPQSCWQVAESERVKLQQCQAELARERAEKNAPDGLTGLLANGQMDAKGVVTRDLILETDFTQRPGETLEVREATSYRARGRVAVELLGWNPSGQPWTVAGAELVGAGGERLKVLRVWTEPSFPGRKPQRVVVEAEATETQARSAITVRLWNEGGSSSVTLEGVRFP